MQTIYNMLLNGRPVATWTDLQLACECFQTSIQVLSQAYAKCELILEKTALLNGTKAPLGLSNPLPEILALFKIEDGRWTTVECCLKFEDGTYKEIS